MKKQRNALFTLTMILSFPTFAADFSRFAGEWVGDCSAPGVSQPYEREFGIQCVGTGCQSIRWQGGYIPSFTITDGATLLHTESRTDSAGRHDYFAGQIYQDKTDPKQMNMLWVELGMNFSTSAHFRKTAIQFEAQDDGTLTLEVTKETTNRYHRDIKCLLKRK